MKINKIIYIPVVFVLIGAVFLVADIQRGIYVSQSYRNTNFPMLASTPTITPKSDSNAIAKECKYVFNHQLEDIKSRVDNNKTAIEIIKNKCLQILDSSFVADFDRDGSK